MAESFNIAYFNLNDELPERAMSKLNYNYRRICAVIQNNQGNISVSAGAASSNQEVTQRYTQAIKQSEEQTYRTISETRSELEEEIARAESRANVYADKLVDEIMPVGIVVAGKSKDECPIKTFGAWRLVNDAPTDGVYFWERTV